MASPHEILQSIWGYSNFRPGQLQLVESIAGGRDTVALLPTGGGKSICYQVPALMKPGLCLVISPLLALMSDQVEQLKRRNVKAYFLNSTLSFKQAEAVLDNCCFGDAKFLYVAPERLGNKAFLDRLPKLRIALVAVDEAHCISEWGHDFRPSYRQIGKFRELLGNVTFCAFTASATPTVLDDIKEQLALKDPFIYQADFVRKNLRYSVIAGENKTQIITRILKRMPGTSIVYANTRRGCVTLSRQLESLGISAGAYHAGLPHTERLRIQHAWTQNKIQVVVATNAFGMGIDKPDVRTVIHHDLPATPEGYYQEAGRAGRDGEESWAVLIARPADAQFLREAIEQSFPTEQELCVLYQNLSNFFQVAIGSGHMQSYPFNLTAFAKKYQMKPIWVLNGLKLLQDHGFLELSESVTSPARFMYTQSPEIIYKTGISHSALQPLLEILARSYTGLFDESVGIREADLARRLGISEKQVKEQLHQLYKLDVCDYQPASDNPTITLLHPRYDALKLPIKKSVTQFRIQRAVSRAHYMERYVKSRSVCRSVLLGEYFGVEGEACGTCDNCTRNKRTLTSAITSHTVWENLRYRGEKSYQLEELCMQFRVDEAELLPVLRILQDEGYIKYNSIQQTLTTLL